MSKIKKLIKQTFIYGLATVLPRVLTLLLTRLYVKNLDTEAFGIYSGLFVYLILGNVLLSYGMETAFFRFMNKNEDVKKVQSTALTSLIISTLLFFVVSFSLRDYIALWLDYDVKYISYAIYILVFDALVVIPFAWLRNQGKSLTYAILKIGNVVINLSLNLFFFNVLEDEILKLQNGVDYIFISNFLASFLTFLALIPLYFRIKIGFSFSIWKEMIKYAFPVLIAGIAFAINEGFDRIFLRILLPAQTADATIGVYSACYKMGVFMTLFVTAYKLGIEPFFFSSANEKNAPKTYALVTEIFTIFGAFILLFIIVFIDFFKLILIPNPQFWEALWIVPIVLLANLCLGIYHSLSVWYKVTDRTNFGAFFSILGMAITLIFNVLLIPILSYKGAALTTLITYFVMMLLSFVVGQKKYPVPYNKRKIIFYCLFSILTSFSVFYIFDRNIYVGLLFLFIYVLIVIFNEPFILRKIPFLGKK